MRAFILASVAVVLATITVLWMLAGSWLAFPAVPATVLSVVVATWSAVDVWVTRQVWIQRHGIVSGPGSTARALSREHRLARRRARTGARVRPAHRSLPQV
ncbi:hypothetical protein [Streptomyces meridianus]|uniref:hypothetical protein n=1 Tax=Streptomyces meridianus TaxID=2938945 RepID=UPI0027E2EF05|nr:hypothetical protein [Streptomyces meridianus]